MKTGISEWTIEYDKYKESLRFFQENEEMKRVMKVKDEGPTFTVDFRNITFRYGVIYDRTNTPHFESWKI